METKAMTAEYYPVIVEQETNGTWSAYVAGLPGVYAAADTATDAKRAGVSWPFVWPFAFVMF